MKLVVFSDIHYSDKEYIRNKHRKMTDKAIPLLNELIKKVNNDIKPDVCICLGDLIQDEHNYVEDIKNLKVVWDKMKEFNIPFYTVIGNHDLKTMETRKEVEEILGYENATFSFDVGNYHLVILTTDIRNDLGNEHGGIFKAQYVSNKEIEWLKKDLKNTDKPTLVFTHFGLANNSLEGNFWFENDIEGAVIKNKEEIKKILKENNVIAVFSGHQHWTKRLVEDGIQYYITGSLTENIDFKEIPDGIYYEVDIENNNIKAVEKHLKLLK